jgi:alkanesulfonate monooxygenase SsuD/methylene tetrahydromethanopterin reductase-like flavin-dependent oxidoreductase (luciferase family)
MEPTDPILDPLVHLAYVAAVTERLELGTGIVILPQRNLLVRVKQAASLAVLSGGRLLLGIGAGYPEPEMTAVGVAHSERGGRTDEYLDAMTALCGRSRHRPTTGDTWISITSTHTRGRCGQAARGS